MLAGCPSSGLYDGGAAPSPSFFRVTALSPLHPHSPGSSVPQTFFPFPDLDVFEDHDAEVLWDVPQLGFAVSSGLGSGHVSLAGMARK